MSNIVYPYQLTEGTKAFATKVMANFNAVITKLNGLYASGIITASDIQSVLTAMAAAINAKVDAGETGNADDIVFDDGTTLQELLDSGELNGTDGVTVYVTGWVTFTVDEYGNLKAATNLAEMPYSLNESGELIYTVPDAESGEYVEYTLGNVMGPSGEVTTAAMQTYVTNQLAAHISTPESCMAYLLNWDDDSESETYKQCVVECNDITAANNFLVDTAVAATADEIAEFQAANCKVIAQEAGQFTLQAYGTLPTTDIPLQVIILK